LRRQRPASEGSCEAQVQLSSNRRRESYENACGAQDAGTYDEASRTGGANGSVAYELDRPENFGLNRGFRPIEKVRTVQHCPMHAFSLSYVSGGWRARRRTVHTAAKTHRPWASHETDSICNFQLSSPSGCSAREAMSLLTYQGRVLTLTRPRGPNSSHCRCLPCWWARRRRAFRSRISSRTAEPTPRASPVVPTSRCRLGARMLRPRTPR
jgi:hypothetical protein